MNARVLAAMFAVCAGCKPDATRPPFEDLPIRIRLEPSETFTAAAPLRAALIFPIPTATVTTTDVAIPEGATSFELTLIDPQLPPDAFEPTVGTVLNRASAQIFFPQLAIYEDADRSGDKSAGDRLVSIDQFQRILFVTNLDRFLRSSSIFPAMQLYYEASGDRYTRFVRIQSSTNEGFFSERHDAELGMVLQPSPFFDELERCWHRGVRSPPRGQALARRGRVILDVEGVMTSTVPELIQQCRTDGTTDAFLVGSFSDGCENCVCGIIEELDVYLTRTSSAPDTWPCGRELEYCASSRPLQELEPTCIE